MKLGNIYKILDGISPFELQEKWDNSGVIVGDFETKIDKVVLSIDVDEALIDSLEENTLLITHHPLIFSGIKQIDFHVYPQNLVVKMIQKKIFNIAMHTNFDKTHLNKFVMEEILGYKIEKEEDFVLYAKVDEKFESFAKKVADAFGLEHLKVVQSHQKIKTVALTTGSGASLLPQIEADCFLTGDIKYHDAMAAKAQNISMIDIGHYESEKFFAQILEKYLKNLGLEVIMSQSKNPFTYL